MVTTTMMMMMMMMMTMIKKHDIKVQIKWTYCQHSEHVTETCGSFCQSPDSPEEAFLSHQRWKDQVMKECLQYGPGRHQY